MFIHLFLFQAVSGLTMCTALVARRVWLSVNPMASACLTANIQKMSEWCATRSAFQASSSFGPRPTVRRWVHTEKNTTVYHSTHTVNTVHTLIKT